MMEVTYVEPAPDLIKSLFRARTWAECRWRACSVWLTSYELVNTSRRTVHVTEHTRLELHVEAGTPLLRLIDISFWDALWIENEDATLS
jgi:hypothetical protein